MEEVTHGGGIVVRFDKDGPKYLVTTAKRNPGHRIFPKGHIEQGETSAETAIREVREETGVEGEVIAPVGTLVIHYEGNELKIEFYLIKYIREVKSDEQRKVFWCSYDEAMKMLSYHETKILLSKAHPLVPKHFQMKDV